MREITQNGLPAWLFTYEDFTWEFFSWNKEGRAKPNLKGPGVRCIHAPSKARCVSAFMPSVWANQEHAFDMMRYDINFQKWWRARAALTIIENCEKDSQYPLQATCGAHAGPIFFAWNGPHFEEINPIELVVLRPTEDKMPFEKKFIGGKIVSPMGGPVG